MPESVIKSYDNSLKANWGRAKGKFRENVPESWRTVLPYLSDVEDALGMQEAFSKDGTTKDRVIALAGLGIPFISAAVLKRFLKSDKVKKLLGSDVGNTAYEQALNEVSSDSPNIQALENNLKQLEKKWGLSFEELNSPRIKGKDLKVATEPEDLGIGKYLQSGTVEYDNGFQLRKYTNPQNNSEDVFLMYDPKTENNIAYMRKYGTDPNSKEFIPITIPENTFHIKADMGNLPKEDVKFAMEELQKVLPPKHSIYESSNISPEGLKMFEQQKKFGYFPTDKTFTTKISNAGRQGSMFSDLNRYGHNTGDQFSEARFLDDNSLNKAVSRVNDYQKQIGTNYNVYPTTQGRGINIDLPYLQRQYATGGEMKKNTNAQFMPTYINGIPTYMCGGKMKYGFGSWLQSNAGNILQTGAGIGSMFIPGGQVAGLSMIASGVGGLATTGDPVAKQEQQLQQQHEQILKQNLISNLPAQPNYIPTFAMGGDITDRVTSFQNGGLHSENGGIPIGQNALVERDEYMFTTKDGKKYIFSNKF